MLLSKLKIVTAMALGASLSPLGGPAAGRLVRTQVSTVSGSSRAVTKVARPQGSDTRLPRPKQVRLTPYVIPDEVNCVQTFTYNINVNLDDGWRIFSFSPERPPRGGPLFTKFDFFDRGGFEVVGDWQASRPATVMKRPPAYPDRTTVEYFEQEVTLSIRLKVPQGLETGPRKLKCQMSFQLMKEESTTVPGRWTLDDASVNVGG